MTEPPETSPNRPADVRSRLILDGRRVWHGDFLPTSELIDRLVELRPDLWGTIRDGRPLTPQLLDSILRPYPDTARPVRPGPHRGRYMHQWQQLVATIPDDAENALRSELVPGEAGLVIELGPGVLDTLGHGGLFRILPILRQSGWDPAVRRAYRVTIEPEPPTLTT